MRVVLMLSISLRYLQSGLTW